MASTVYLLCTLASTLCALLLLREYRRTSSRLLLWSGLSFSMMAVSNALVFVDLVIVPQIDLALTRGSTFMLATALLLYGLVWDTD
jgi:hypothetical protein